jgi:hypothetical protein
VRGSSKYPRRRSLRCVTLGTQIPNQQSQGISFRPLCVLCVLCGQPNSSKPNNTKTMSKSQFVTSAPEITPLISGQPIAATRKKFSTGSVGYNLNGKVTLADGTRLQVTGNAIVIGSKDWSE